MLPIVLAVAAATAQPAPGVVDATTLRGKVLCGYQGWFRCPGDPSNMGWLHWCGNQTKIAPDNLTVDMWPDMREYGPGERYEAPGFTYPDGTPASLFSSDNPDTVLRHFQWMQQYGIDVAVLQHFVVDLPSGTLPERYGPRMNVLGHVRRAAQETGRAWVLAYDMAGMPTDRVYDTMVNEWKSLVDQGVTRDPRYLHHDGKPVLIIFGFYTDAGNMDPATASRIIDFFRGDRQYGVFLLGGCNWWWRTYPPDWLAFVQRLDGVIPWNAGHTTKKDEVGNHWADTATWAEDLAWTRQRRMLYIPTVHPGFTWDNVRRLPPGQSLIPRRRGLYYWQQWQQAALLGLDMLYVGMFDEVDEGTAIFKVTNHPPVQGHFVTYEGMPTDWYLRLTWAGGRLLRGELPVGDSIPLEALEELPPLPGTQPRLALFHEAEQAFKLPAGWTTSNLWEPSGGLFIYCAGGDAPAEALIDLPAGQEWLVWVRVRDETDGQRQMMAQVNGVDSYVLGGANSTQWVWYCVGTVAEELLQVVMHSLSPGMEGWTDCLYATNDPSFVPPPTPATPTGFRTLTDPDPDAGQPAWLWWPAEPVPDMVAYYRKEFDLKAAPQSAVLVVQAPGPYAAYVNGVEVANRVAAGPPETLDVTQHLTPGPNVLSFTAVHLPPLSGIRALLSGTYADGSRWRVKTDPSWQASDEPAEGWQQAGFSNATWQRPWCRLGDREASLGESPAGG